MAAGATAWSFAEGDLTAIRGVLDEYLGATGAKTTMLVDRAGQLITTAGEVPAFDATAFATLTAAEFSANDQLARLVGETDFSSLFHEGERESLYVADIARQLILVVLFDSGTTLGLVKLRARGTVERLTDVFDGVLARGRVEHARNGGILAGAHDEIDRLFS